MHLHLLRHVVDVVVVFLDHVLQEAELLRALLRQRLRRRAAAAQRRLRLLRSGRSEHRGENSLSQSDPGQ